MWACVPQRDKKANLLGLRADGAALGFPQPSSGIVREESEMNKVVIITATNGLGKVSAARTSAASGPIC
jgi:hypothetical protein